MIYNIRLFFAKRKVAKDKKKNGHWSDLLINPRNGKCITEREYLNKYS